MKSINYKKSLNYWEFFFSVGKILLLFYLSYVSQSENITVKNTAAKSEVCSKIQEKSFVNQHAWSYSFDNQNWI